MVIEMMLIGLLVLLVLVGAGVGIVLVGRSLRAAQGTGIEADSMSPRVVCEVRTGEEQLLIRLAHELALPSGRDDVAYGQVYLAGTAGSTLRLQTRSEIGRGFDAEIRVHRSRRSSVAEYFVLRVPADDAVLQQIASLDERIVHAARTLDPQAQVRRAGERRRAPSSMNASLG